MTIKKNDWVKIKDGWQRGFVLRVAKDGKWADVRWKLMGEEYTKRMKTTSIEPLHTIPLGNGWTVTDVAREKELESFVPTEPA